MAAILNNTTKFQYKDIDISDYKDFIDIIELKMLGSKLKNKKVLHINATPEGGGVAAILQRMIPLLNSLGFENHWYVPDITDINFFTVTKKHHNMFQGLDEKLSKNEKKLYWSIQEKVAQDINNWEHYDIIFLHDTQYLGLINFLPKGNKQAYIYRCHIDTTSAVEDIKNFFLPVIEKCDSAVYHIKDFILTDKLNNFIMPPSTDPFEPKNQIELITEMDKINALKRFNLDINRPVLTQVGRFDPAKGFDRVYRIYRRVKETFPDVQLLLTGAGASDDPEFYTFIKGIKDLVTGDKDAVAEEIPYNVKLLNAIQQASTIIYAMSTKEGFGLVASEAAIKKKPIIVSNVGGLPQQVVHGKTGYIANNDDEAVHYTLTLLKNKNIVKSFGTEAKNYILSKFITPIDAKNQINMFIDTLNTVNP